MKPSEDDLLKDHIKKNYIKPLNSNGFTDNVMGKIEAIETAKSKPLVNPFLLITFLIVFLFFLIQGAILEIDHVEWLTRFDATRFLEVLQENKVVIIGAFIGLFFIGADSIYRRSKNLSH